MLVKLRFEILKRDNFTCQYCGRSPQNDNIVLQVDHINPISNGGQDTSSNLITSCRDCNIGKRDFLLNKHQERKLIKKYEESYKEIIEGKSKQKNILRIGNQKKRFSKIPDEWVSDNYVNIKGNLGLGFNEGRFNNDTHERLTNNDLSNIMDKCILQYEPMRQKREKFKSNIIQKHKELMKSLTFSGIEEVNNLIDRIRRNK